MTPTHVYRWAKYMPWKGRPCVVLARGRLNSILVQFCDDGSKAITNRYAVRRLA